MQTNSNNSNSLKRPKESAHANVTRRDFLKNTSLLAATAAGAGLIGSTSSAAAKQSPSHMAMAMPLRKKLPIRAIIIGVGSRGSGAGRDFTEACKALGVDGKIVAVADMFPEKAIT